MANPRHCTLARRSATENALCFNPKDSTLPGNLVRHFFLDSLSRRFTERRVLEHECSLRRVDIRRYLDASSRTWSVDDDAIDEIDSDVQSLVDCTEEGDVLLFNATKRIRPSAPVVLPWPLTLSAFVEHTELEDDAFPKAVKKATFACPRDNEGVFLVR